MSEPHLDPPVPGIAVVGLAARFPGARTAAELWRNLRDGVESVTFFSDEELAAAGVDPALLGNPAYVKAKGLLQDAELFDAALFGFTPREAEWMDPQHRVFLECAWEALEDAGLDPRRAEGRVGVYAGSGASTYLISNLLPHRELVEKMGVLQLLVLNDRDFLATRASYKLDLKGPSVSVQTACSTSLVAIHLACQGLLTGECDVALAGGVSISSPLANGYLYEPGNVMSPDGRCRAFDAGAAGTVEGNGCGVVVLKRLADALADGDRIYAVVCGSAVNNDGFDKVGFTAPSVSGQAEAISEALLISGVAPDSIGYVETHGSGTPLGDPIEIEALTQAFRSAGTDRTGFCAIGSVKTNLGHCNAAAGVAGFIKAILSLAHRTVPPSLHFERPNPRIDFAASPFYVGMEAAPWETGGAPRRAGVSAFGLGGTNAHAVLEEAPFTEPGDPPSRAYQLLVLSARAPEALDVAAARLADHLEANPDLELADAAWTLQVGRRELEHRRAVVARDRGAAATALRDPVHALSVQAAERRPVVFLFPGLGDHSLNMARELYETEPVFREQVDLCSDRLVPLLGCDLREVLFPGAWPPPAPSQGPGLKALLRRDGRPEDPASARLNQTAFAQPACFVIEHALARLLLDWGIEPQAMIGYSIGEYVAACLAGVLSLDDALSLVALRARRIQELPPGAMLAVPLPEEKVLALLGEGLSVCATNGPHFCVVGGATGAVEEMESRLAGLGVSCLRLQTTHAFHSSMMEPAFADVAAMAAGIEARPPRIPYLSNVTGTWITEVDLADPSYWARHMRGTVRFAESLGELLKTPGRVYLEVGPGGTLGTLVKQHPDAPADLVAVPSLGRAGSDVESLLAAVGRLWAAGVEIDWKRFQGGERRRRVSLPTYPFERRRFWIDPPAASSKDSEARRTLDLEDWFWVPAWKQVPLRQTAVAPSGESWLIFLDRPGLGDRLAARLRAAGHAVATAAAGAEFQASPDGAFTLDPGRRQDYDALVRHLGDRLPSKVVHLWGVTEEEPSLDEARTLGLLSLVLLDQAFTGAVGDGPPLRIAMVANGLHDLVDGDPIHPGKAVVLGAVRVIHQESARISCGSLDVVLPPSGSPRENLLLGQIVAEMAGAPGELMAPVVAFRGRHRWVQTFDATPLPGDAPGSRLAEGGVYLVADGAHGPGGLGQAIAGYLARTLGARVVLAVPPQAPEGIGGEVGSGRVLVVPCELADAGGVSAVLAEARARFGAVRGVFLAPGSFPGGLVQLKTPEALRGALDPVAHQAEALFAALAEEPEPPGFVVLSSSTFAVTGGLGQLDIAAAGAFLDAMALRQAGLGGPFTAAVHWDPYQWDGWLANAAGGALGLQPHEVRSTLEAYGVTAARSGEALRRLLAQDLPRLAVSARDLHDLMAETETTTAETLLAHLEAVHRGPKTQRPGLSTPYVAPRNETEESLAAIWQELFGIRPIGVEDSFLELGGHSLLAIQMLTELRRAFGVDLPVTALFETPTVAGLAVAIAQARGEETAEDLEELLAFVEGLTPEEAARRIVPAASNPQRQPPPVRNLSGPAGIGDWPLSFDQERLLRLHLDNPRLVSWNVDAGTRIVGPLDVPAMLAAVEGVVRRHAAWRATFPIVDGRRVQRVAPWLAPETAVLDLTALPRELREPAAHHAFFDRTRAVFDLERGPLVRVTFARLSGREHLCQLTVHHLVTDWITFQYAWRELLAFYEAHRAGWPAELPALHAQYPDFVVWEREWLQGESLEEHSAFWRRQLAGFPLALDLPTDRPRPPVQSQRGGLYRVRTGAELSDRLRALGRREGATMFMTVLALLSALLHRFSGLQRMVLGSNSANRARPELEPVFGLFLTQVPFAIDLEGDPTFRELLGRARSSALASYAHQNFPFSKLLEALRPEPDPSRNPVVQALLLVLEGQSRSRAGDLDLHAVPLFDGSSRWDLMLGVYDYKDIGLSGPLEYNADVFDASTMGRLLELFYRLIDAVTADPDLPLSQLPGMSEAAARQALVEWRGDSRSSGELLARLAAARATGDAAARIVCGEESVLYGDLERQADGMAGQLRRLGVWPGARVALLLRPSPQLAAAVLAVWRAGGICVPLDPAGPAAHRNAALADAELAAVIHDGSLPEGAATGAVRLDVSILGAAPQAAAPLPVLAAAEEGGAA